MRLASVPVYVIHGAHLTARRDRLEAQLRDAGVEATWVTDPAASQLARSVRRRHYRRDRRRWRERAAATQPIPFRPLAPVEIAATIAHVDVYRRVAAGVDEWALILEDDAVLAAGFGERFDELLRDVPDDADLIFIGSSYDLRIEATEPGVHLYRKDHPATKCADSYLIRRRAAAALLETIVPFVLPIDWELNHQLARHDLHVYWLEPPLVAQGSLTGDYASSLRADAAGMAGSRRSRARAAVRGPGRRRLMRAARAAMFGFRDATPRIDSPRFWRAVYALMATRAAPRLARRIASAVGEPDAVLERFSHLFLTGWPHHRGTPWINLNVLRFVTEARRVHARPASPRPPRTTIGPLRVGLLANMQSTLTFSPPFFTSAPDDVEVHVFDLAGPTHPPGYLERHVVSHAAFDAGETDGIARAVEAAELDLLLFDVYKADIHAILDRVSTPCVVDIGTTVQLRFHPNVSFHLYCLQQADYLLRGRRLFCATAETWLDERRVVPGTLLFDARGLDAGPTAPWAEREPLLVFHNKLYKASEDYLDAVLGALLAEDSALTFVAMGRDSDGALARIQDAARRYGVSDRVHYEGEFSPARGDTGEVVDPGWRRVAELLARARLVPDPWPLGGASSRVEAYAAGAPVVHMGIRTDPGSWRRPQPAVTADHPGLELATLTAHTVDEYVALARRALADATFADAAAAEQAALAARVTDGEAFWRQILEGYAEWLAATGSTSASSERGS